MRRAHLRPRRAARRAEWLGLGAVVVAAGLLAAPLGRLVAGDGRGPPLPPRAESGPPALPAAETDRASPAGPGRLPAFARLRPDLVAHPPPALPPSAVSAEMEAALAPPGAQRRPSDARVPEGVLDPGLNTRGLRRPGDEAALPEKEAEELRQRLRPGFTAPVPTRVPFVHTDVIAPQLTPDVEVAVSDRTRLGVFGQVKPAGDGKSVPFPGIINRPLGAGVTLEYRFGTR